MFLHIRFFSFQKKVHFIHFLTFPFKFILLNLHSIPSIHSQPPIKIETKALLLPFPSQSRYNDPRRQPKAGILMSGEIKL